MTTQESTVLIDAEALRSLLQSSSSREFPTKLRDTFTFATSQFASAVQTALVDLDRKVLTYWAHRLRSGAEILGALQLAESCAHLESASRIGNDLETRARAEASLKILAQTIVAVESEFQRYGL